MAGLIGMIKPLLGFMFLAILMGCAGNLCAIFIPVMGGYGLLSAMGLPQLFSLKQAGILLVVFAAVRAFLRYTEQACNHYIAFKLLAQIRHKVFAALRRLAPAKLEGKERGNLISMITTDIELLEVFYAHTLSPIAIAVITSICMVVYIALLDLALGALALCAYLVVGALIPVINGRMGSKAGQAYRDGFGQLNTVVLDNLRGMDEILQYHQGEKRKGKMEEQNKRLERAHRRLKGLETGQTTFTDIAIMSAGGVCLVMAALKVSSGNLSFAEGFLATIAMMSSFGPVAALSSVSNNLNQTLACGNRVLDLLEEEPLVEEITEGVDFRNGDINAENLTFSYGKSQRPILSDFTAELPKGKITGILGKSGCGKSTFLKLLMRFFQTDKGSISYGGRDLERIKTRELRKHIAYVEQDTFLFHDTIGNNIKVGNLDATDEEVKEAAQKASLHDFVMKLPHGYDTLLSELGDSLSGGERQRIGIARAFLHDPDMIFLDEPTSNLDSLNESVILKSLKEEAAEKTVVLVSHRKSTMGIAQQVIRM
ncbi:thiol reductant ABC exporter subunit CydC [bacterium 210820-DFI.6.37]|nr:thiol reductant ABC exporter subunit CydC [bacterium 210820-DFI.6.37]